MSSSCLAELGADCSNVMADITSFREGTSSCQCV
jgi:hypothetical protein